MNSKITEILPSDQYNQQLISLVHPHDWINPKPQKQYDLVVIGAGTAGLVVAAGAAGLDLGLKIALIEKHLMGGDCLNFGCVPSKAIIRSGKIIGEILKAEKLGIKTPENEIDFAYIMERMRKIRAGISHHDSAQRFKNLGIDVFFGSAHFFDQNTIEVEGLKLHYKKAVIATGAKPIIPNIGGINDVNFYTNETIFSLTKLPSSLAVMGGGAIGSELAQVFNRLGSQVTLLHKHDYILNKEDKQAREIIQNTFLQEGINLILNSQILKVELTENGKKIDYISNGQKNSITVSDILVCIGREPNIKELNLEKVGVEYDLKKGVKINDYLQTTNPRIFAAGDVCLGEKFTHTADAAARIVIKNTLFSPFGLGKAKFSDLIIPRVTYTDPEVAHVGKSPHQLVTEGLDFNTITVLMDKVDRAITDEETEGFVKIYHQKNSDKILGATIVASHAGEMISEITLAMVNNIGLNGISKVIHSYPTQAEAIKKAADAYRRTLLNPQSRRILKLLSKLT
ncbi:mercuric reductase [Cyanobacterium aponinum]|uniref:mercuric reductase n=1 Tax=Cyanobacterium aponinum TaxID=379064 RepID=UPI000C12A617|nr:mercuric reductase [Cyanobacterium aponinum]PHV63215.1 mercuric reductase [Cyanobacterium aponinum IPPAS B-1201]